MCKIKMPVAVLGILLLLFMGSTQTFSQSIPIGTFQDNELRNEQLIGNYDSLVSFGVRPLREWHKADWKKVHYTILPLTLTQQYNSHHPYGWDDGAMIAAKGYQGLLSGGVYARYGALEVQLMPEAVYAANPAYASNASFGSNAGGVYQKLFAGQSSVRLNAGPLSVGVSTENLWWGPGRYSSLLMSNNAPGFGHLFFQTRRPLRTPIGSFEWQLIGGKLLADPVRPYENNNLQSRVVNNDWRYLSAVVVTYHPKWTEGLFLGFTRAIQTYQSETFNGAGSFTEKYIPVIALAFQKKNVTSEDSKKRDQLASFFLRWLFQKAKAEFYLEYGFNDYSINTRDYLLGPSHSAAYITGFKKILPLKNKAYLDLGFELTQMSQTPDYLVRESGNWYVHSQIYQGYTNENQIMGAGAGFGANVQDLSVNWIRGTQQLGFLVERIDHDPVVHPNKWVDWGIGFLPQYQYKNMLFSGVFQVVNSSQYAWEEGRNVVQVHARVRVAVSL